MEQHNYSDGALGSGEVDGYDALILVSFGAPERAEDVMPFLRKVTDGRGVPEERLAAVAEHYYQAGGASPLNERCRQLLAALEGELAGLALRLYWGNRNWAPLLPATIAQMRNDGVQRALALVTSAYGGYSSCRQYLDDIATARAAVGPGAPVIDKLRLFYNHPGWVGAWADSLGKALALCGDVQGPVEILFSAHSIPQPMANTSPYVQHVTETAALTAGLAGAQTWRLVWQSRSGSPSAPWLGPDIGEVIATSQAAAIVVAPIGFVCDNMEIVHDLDVEAAALAEKKGARFVRARSVSGHPLFVSMVRELVQERLDGTAPKSLGAQGPWPDHCPEGHCPAPKAPPGAGPLPSQAAAQRSAP